ncbi:MAG: endonuclease/exonuclease/phosphatase family protein [Betaproteobacteria bacterium]
MKLITWNIQWCRGVDGKVDPARVVAHAKRLADFDVLCLQEVADNFPDPRLPGNSDENQFERLAALLPGYTGIPGIAVDHPGDHGRRRRFGNMILTRLPVLQVFAHQLPYPADQDVSGMPRIAIEAVVEASFGPVRIVTTHLEYYSLRKRAAQVEALRMLYAEGSGYARDPRSTGYDGGPYETLPRPAATIITGDFNLEPDDPLHVRMEAPFADGTPPLFDAWTLANPRAPHPPTMNIFQKVKPDDPLLHCDFIFVSDVLRSRVRAVDVDVETQVSDHQPVTLTLG